MENSRLVQNIQRLYNYERRGIYDPVLLYDVCWDIRSMLEHLILSIGAARNRTLVSISRQFDVVLEAEIKESTVSLSHELFLFNTLEKHLKECKEKIKQVETLPSEQVMLIIDVIINGMHIDYPLYEHFGLGNIPLLQWIVVRRVEQGELVQPKKGLRELFGE